MLFAGPESALLRATSPGLLLLAVGSVLFMRKAVHRAISATALAMALALLVLQLFVIGVPSKGALYGIADSRVLIVGVPLASFVIWLWLFSHRARVSFPNSASCGAIGLIGLWCLGGFVVINTACGISPSGGC